MTITTENSIAHNHTVSPASIVDAAKVRLGAQGPVFRPTLIADNGKVRLGAQAPIFR